MASRPRPFSLSHRGRKLRGNGRIWSGTILLAIGLSVVLLVGEWFAAFDACLANPDCDPLGSLPTMEGYLGLMILGVGIAVCGAVTILIGWRISSLPETPENL
jgi:hypothetical protein